MKIFRAKNPLVFGLLLDRFVVDERVKKEQIAEELAAMMLNRPDETVVIVCIDGEELKGFTTGWEFCNSIALKQHMSMQIPH